MWKREQKRQRIVSDCEKGQGLRNVSEGGSPACGEEARNAKISLKEFEGSAGELLRWRERYGGKPLRGIPFSRRILEVFRYCWRGFARRKTRGEALKKRGTWKCYRGGGRSEYFKKLALAGPGSTPCILPIKIQGEIKRTQRSDTGT